MRLRDRPAVAPLPSTVALFDAEFARATCADRNPDWIVLDAEYGFVRLNLWFEQVTIPHGSNKVRGQIPRLDLFKIISCDYVSHIFVNENESILSLTRRNVGPWRSGLISRNKGVQVFFHSSSWSDPKFVRHDVNVDRRSFTDIFPFDAKSNFHITGWLDNNPRLRQTRRNRSVGHNPRPLFGTELELRICESVFGGFRVPVCNRNLPHVQDYGSLGLVERVLHQPCLFSINAVLQIPDKQNPKGQNYDGSLGPIRSMLTAYVAPSPSSPEDAEDSEGDTCLWMASGFGLTIAAASGWLLVAGIRVVTQGSPLRMCVKYLSTVPDSAHEAT
jgi:hypothetical protein